LILALDAGTSSVRASLYDAAGCAIEGAESRIAYQMTATPDGGIEIDADELLGLVCRVIDELLQRAEALASGLVTAIAGVGCCTFWHSLLGIGEREEAVTPLYNWSDTRSASDADALAERFGSEWFHERTGAVPHASYYPAKLLWLRRTDPARYNRVTRWLSFGEYLHLKLCGQARCSVSVASGTGLFNPNTCVWDPEVLDAVGITAQQLSPLSADDETMVGLRGEYAARWPALREVPWLPVVGDGAASNIGSGCVTEEPAALMVGTSGALRVCWPAERVRIPRGLWCYRANRRYVVMGGALSNGGNVYAWCRRVLQLHAPDAEWAPDEIERRLAAMEPDGHGLTMLPFFSGERSTGWADYARAAVTGLSLSTGPLEILRAALEAVAYRFAAIYDRLSEEVPGATRIVASGGGLLRSPAWTQIMADVMGRPVAASAVMEASSRGAALLALQALGHIADLAEVSAPLGSVYEPDAARHERYLRARQRQQRLYDVLIAPGPFN
jgi:gluconokinase